MTPALPLGRIQAWAAREFRATTQGHQLPWKLFVFLVWLFIRPVFRLTFALGRYAWRKELDARFAAT